MKTLLLCSMLLALSSCQFPAPAAERVTEVVTRTVEAADSNRDGTLTNREVTDAKNNPLVWITAITSILSIFGVGKAVSASSDARTANMRISATHELASKVEKETDEQWDYLAKTGAMQK